MVSGRAFFFLLSLLTLTGVLTYYQWSKGRISRRTAVLLPVFVTCVGFILAITIFERIPGRKTLSELKPFWSYKAILEGSRFLIAENFWNVVLFIPFSFLLGLLFPKRKHWMWVLAGFLLSVVIELVQLVFRRGLFEFDDIFHNTLGALLGILLLRLISRQPLKKGLIAVGLSFAVVFLTIGIEMALQDKETVIDTSARVFNFQLDDASFKGEKLLLSGFAFRYDTDSETRIADDVLRLVLKNTQSEREVELNVIYGQEREDVDRYFECGTDYSACGFTADTMRTGISSKAEYEILAGWNGKGLQPTGVYITGEDIHYHTEKDFVPPAVEGTDLEKIVGEGCLRVYRPDQSCYVYQYENALYWIADEGFAFEADGTTYIQYQLWTTQINNLPQSRLDNGWYWDNIGGDFESYEITDEMDCGKYRVSRRELPAEYPVTTVATGYYVDNDWVWRNYFRPFYIFEQ